MHGPGGGGGGVQQRWRIITHGPAPAHVHGLPPHACTAHNSSILDAAPKPASLNLLLNLLLPALTSVLRSPAVAPSRCAWWRSLTCRKRSLTARSPR